ncbi:uncharacterized protein LOC143374129 [Andrena cerasifolii]|uniref:uncharacterized protein LOC143374129 n=1 Tax=Andrena cerasifolii TaxID=2819439 RepID=UPI0040378455
MIVATHKCGCPPKEEKPPCSPCCSSGKTTKAKRPSLPTRPECSCCKKPRLQPMVSLPKILQPPPCCPTKPSGSSSDLCAPKVRSEIAEKGLPYKELEAVINNNRVVIRTQKEVPRQEYDPPCDCIEDSQPAEQAPKEDEDSVGSSKNRTVTLFPSPREDDPYDDATSYTTEADEPPKVEENPNIFRLRVRKKSRASDGYNIDLEFRTPRPWSMQRRCEITKREKLA